MCIATVNVRKKTLRVETDPETTQSNIRSSVDYLVHNTSGNIGKKNQAIPAIGAKLKAFKKYVIHFFLPLSLRLL